MFRLRPCPKLLHFWLATVLPLLLQSSRCISSNLGNETTRGSINRGGTPGADTWRDLYSLDAIGLLPDLHVDDSPRGDWLQEDPGSTSRDLVRYSRCPLLQLKDKCSAERTSEIVRYRWDGRTEDTRTAAFPEALVFLEGKTVMFAGDSLSRQQFISLMCLCFEAGYYVQHDKTKLAFGTAITAQVTALKMKAVYVPSAFLLQADLSRKKRSADMIHFAKLDQNIVAHLHQHRPHLLLFNVGAWAGQKSLGRNVSEWSRHYAHIVQSLQRILASKVRDVYDNQRLPRPMLVWRSSTQSHFEGGDWNSGGGCHRHRPCRANAQDGYGAYDRMSWFSSKADFAIQNALAISAFRSAGWDLANGASTLETSTSSRNDSPSSPTPIAHHSDRDRWEEHRRSGRVAPWTSPRQHGDPLQLWLLDAQALARDRCDAHASLREVKGRMLVDCLHWCLPGVVDHWNLVLLRLVALHHRPPQTHPP